MVQYTGTNVLSRSAFMLKVFFPHINCMIQKKIMRVKLLWVEWSVPLHCIKVGTINILMKARNLIKHFREGRNWNDRPAWNLA